MANIVFILGAGASKDSGCPVMREFLDVAGDILSRNAEAGWAENYRKVFDARDALQAVHSKADLDISNVESVFAAFEMAKILGRLGAFEEDFINNLSDAMKDVIVNTIQLTMEFPFRGQTAAPQPPQPYDKFADLMTQLREAATPRHTVAVITFNYDIGLDYALHWKSKPVWYGLPGNRRPGSFPVLKLHGSLNWGYCDECKAIVPWPIDQYVSSRRWSPFPDTRVARVSIGSQIQKYEGHSHPLSKYPFVVPPTWNKSSHYETLAPVWRAAAHELSEAEHILVIGYSLPESDVFFRYMYALGTVGRPLKQIWVCDPDDTGKVKERFKALLGPAALGRFQYKHEGFNAVVSHIAGEFGV